MNKLKTLKDLNNDPTLPFDIDINGFVKTTELKAEAVKEINNLEELEYILGLMSEQEKRILIKYIKWKFNLTEEDLK
jgi:hypothetical protein